MAQKSTKYCKCSPNCPAIVLMANRIYARGHNPAFWNRDRMPPEARTMTAAEFTEYQAKLRQQFGAYAIEKKLSSCIACGYVDGVRGLLRHREVCPKKQARA